MVMSKLHIICGNCGSNDELTFYIDPKGHDISEGESKFEPAVFIACGNCSTLHDLSDFIENTTWPEMPIAAIERVIISHQRIGTAMKHETDREKYSEDLKQIRGWLGEI